NGSQLTIQSEFSDDQIPGESFHRELTRAGEHPQGDRKVERAALLPHVRWREVHCHSARWHLEPAVPDCGEHPLFGFLPRPLSAPNRDERRDPAHDIDLHPHEISIDSGKGTGEYAREHRRVAEWSFPEATPGELVDACFTACTEG